MSRRVRGGGGVQGSGLGPQFRALRRCCVAVLAVSAASGCRLDNPGFSPDQQGSEAVRSDEESTRDGESTDVHSDATLVEVSSSNEEDSPSAKDTVVGSSQSSASSTLSSSSSSSSSVTATTTEPEIVCGGKERHCYDMQASSLTYLPVSENSPDLVPANFSIGMAPVKDQASALFAHHGQVGEVGDGVLETSRDVDSGDDGQYGYDLTIRKTACLEKTDCGLAILGDVGLHIFQGAKNFVCILVQNGQEVMRTEPVPIDMTGQSTVGCSLHGKELSALIQGTVVSKSYDTDIAARGAFGGKFGGAKYIGGAGKWTGEVGRFRIWDDVAAMKADFEN